MRKSLSKIYNDFVDFTSFATRVWKIFFYSIGERTNDFRKPGDFTDSSLWELCVRLLYIYEIGVHYRIVSKVKWNEDSEYLGFYL